MNLRGSLCDARGLGRQSGRDWVRRQRRNEIMWRAARPAGGRLYVRGTGLPNRTERHAGGVHQPCRTPRQSWGALQRGPVVGLATVAGCVRARRRDEPARRPRPSTTSRHCRGRAGSRPAWSMYFCYLFACRCGGIYRFRALAVERAIEMWFVYGSICTWRHVELQSL